MKVLKIQDLDIKFKNSYEFKSFKKLLITSGNVKSTLVANLFLSVFAGSLSTCSPFCKSGKFFKTDSR